MSDTLKFPGVLEVDQKRGVIYFHSCEGMSLLRICRLPTPIPNPLTFINIDQKPAVHNFRLLDINFKMPQADWAPCSCGPDSDSEENLKCPVHGIM